MSEELPEFAKSITELATLMGVPRKTIYEWKVKASAPPTPPKKIPVQAWVNWIKENTNKAQTDPEKFGDGETSIGDLKKRELEEKVKKLEIDNAMKSSQLMEISEVVKIWNMFAVEWRKVIENSGLDKIEKDRCFTSLESATERIKQRVEKSGG